MKFKDFFIILFIAFFFIGCGKEEKLTNREIKTIKVEVLPIKLIEFPIYKTVDGFVSSNKVAFISPKINGYIEKFYVKAGDKVKKGGLLFKIKNKEIQEKVRSLKYKLRSLKIKEKEAKISISIYKKSVVQAKANFILAKKNFIRFRNLLKTDSVTKQEFDKMETNFINAKEELKKAKDMLKISKLKLKEIKNDIKSVKSSFKELKVISDYRLVKAPFSGIVLEKYMDEGNLVSPGIKVLKIGSFDKVAYFSIPLKYKNFIKNYGYIKINGRDSKIIEISPDIKRSSSQFTVKAKLNSKDIYENGQYIKGEIFSGKRKVIVLDPKFVRKYNDFYYTYVCKNGFVIKTFITGEFWNKNKFIVKTGLQEGDHLIVKPVKDFQENLRCVERMEKNAS